MIPVLELLFRKVVPERMGVIVLSALVCHTAWHWMTDRYAVFNQFHIQMPQFNDAFFATFLHWAMAAIVIAGALWGISAFANGRRPKPEGESSTPVA
jgi:hypothetical protein